MEALKKMMQASRPSVTTQLAPFLETYVIRIAEEMTLTEDFIFRDENAIVVIEQNLIGIGKKVSIVARNVIVLPNVQLTVHELEVRTKGAALLLNVNAHSASLETQGDAVLGNSYITFAKVNSVKRATVFGFNMDTPIPLINHYDAIVEILKDVIPFDAHCFFQGLPQPSVAQLTATENQ